MPTVLGLDPSLTCTGGAYISRGTDGQLVTETWSIKTPKTTEDLAAKHRRQDRIYSRLVEQGINRATFAVIEAPSYGSAGGQSWERAGLWWRLVGHLVDHRVPVAQVAPTTRAKFATGRGDASKQAVLEAMRDLWAGHDLRIDNHNEADALVFATLAAQHLGWDVPTRAHHHYAHDVIRWPGMRVIAR